MSEDVTNLQKKLQDLQGSLTNLVEERDEREGELQSIPTPELPKEASLDKHEALMVDAIMWREDAALSKMKLVKSEREMCRLMRQNLVTTVSHRLGVDMNQYDISINQDTKKVMIAKRQ